MMLWLKVNPIGIILGAIAYILMGIVFYSQWALGRFWPDLISHMQRQAEGVPAKVYLGAFISALVISYAMGCFLNIANAKTIGSGVFIGLLTWAGFILPTIFSPALFGKKPLGMFWLDAVYYLTAYVVLGIITAKFNS
jgi:hypothetical protein